ncbi:MAG: tetratricopeptide repeat protein [Oscillospiraceae bacterium]|nr:tetratricopeptide repeat protein [Oscillospiraceae bacterium]
MDDVKRLLDEYDKLCETASDEEVEQWLQDVCARYDEEASADVPGRAALYNELGAFYKHREIFDKGEAAFRAAKALLEMPVRAGDEKGCCGRESLMDGQYGAPTADRRETADYATVLNNLAGLYRLTKRFDEAEALFAQAESVYRADENTPKDLLASCSNNLALVYMDQGRWADALSRFERAMEILRDAPDKEYERATTDGNMTVALARLGRIEEAKTHLTAASETFTRLLGPDSDVCKGLAYLAKMLGA